MNEIVEHVDARSDPVKAGGETRRQGKEREREQNEKQIAHDIHRYFRIPVESCRSIPLGLDQCMKQIDKERERQRAGDPQHGFPLYFICAATPRDRRRNGPCHAGAGPCDAPMLIWQMGCDSVEIRVSKRCSISLQGIKKL
ncbi:hypothetical protein [Burkholderia sp. BCC0322]|uniref:hypothetical protein n=1 Tax=unclassified Burkholderia TaxID=2613784 RepID=UPI001FC87FFE|nr:hypothetical protein [Burkholderia sp. BCC0322]